MPHYDRPGAIARLPGESFVSFAARQKASQSSPPKKIRKSRKKVSAETKRDDIGESPDR